MHYTGMALAFFCCFFKFNTGAGGVVQVVECLPKKKKKLNTVSFIADFMPIAKASIQTIFIFFYYFKV
jgi:hypothetical protein